MHQALYRKYRPQTFNDVVGQKAVTETLKNQVRDGTFAHAYLFTGTRGTGKTSCARLFAKAINCLNPSDGEPCGECELCRGFSDASITDITEIDAATNNGVDSVRQLRDSVDFRPVLAKYKVYVIDEVHMLSDSAYNALLKTIEEPPSYVVFILATTEINKVPATILSRCQRFDFRRVPTSEIADRIREILRQEGAKMDEQSIELVAELGDGSVRDALSVLEKVVNLDGIDAVRSVLGVIDRDVLFSLMRSVCAADIEGIYKSVDGLYAGSKDLGVLCSELLMCYRSLLIVKSVRDYNAILNKSKHECDMLSALAAEYSQERILYAMDKLQQTYQLLSKSPNKRADMELCLLRIACPALDADIDALAARVEKLEHAAFEKPIKPKTAAKRTEEPTVPKAADLFAEPKAEPITRTSDSGYNEFLSWADVCKLISEDERFLGLSLKNSCAAVYKDNQIIVLCSDEEQAKDICNTRTSEIIKSALEKLRKTGYEVSVKPGRKSDYIGSSETYDHLETNPMFEFEE